MNPCPLAPNIFAIFDDPFVEAEAPVARCCMRKAVDDSTPPSPELVHDALPAGYEAYGHALVIGDFIFEPREPALEDFDFGLRFSARSRRGLGLGPGPGLPVGPRPDQL